MFNVGPVEVVVILALMALVVGGIYRLIGFAVRREVRKREGS